ncbi:sodium:calcium antiporter [Patescibacteria group bacterium]
MFTYFLIIIISSLVIYYSGRKFASASSEIGEYFNLSRSVKGATLDAVAGSFPELMIAIYAVLVFGKFDVGVGTIAGSVLFNTLIIPSIAVLVSPVVFRVSREVLARDAIFYSISVLVFLAAILYSTSWGLAMAVIFIGIYFWYIDMIIEQTETYQENHERMLGAKISVTGKIISAVVNMFIVGIAAYFLTENAILFAQVLGIPALIIGFSVIAIATSIPDTVIAITNARKGHTDDVISNVFGSNIFNILIALGVPLFLHSAITKTSIDIVSGGIDLVIGLILATVIVIYFIIDDYTITKKNAVFTLILYIAFLVYMFIKAF